MSHQVQTGPPCFLNSFPERSLGAAGLRTNLRPQQLMSKEYVCVFTVSRERESHRKLAVIS